MGTPKHFSISNFDIKNVSFEVRYCLAPAHFDMGGGALC